MNLPLYYLVRQSQLFAKAKGRVKPQHLICVTFTLFCDTYLYHWFLLFLLLHVFYKILFSPFYGSMGPVQLAFTRSLCSTKRY